MANLWDFPKRTQLGIYVTHAISSRSPQGTGQTWRSLMALGFHPHRRSRHWRSVRGSSRRQQSRCGRWGGRTRPACRLQTPAGSLLEGQMRQSPVSALLVRHFALLFSCVAFFHLNISLDFCKKSDKYRNQYWLRFKCQNFSDNFNSVVPVFFVAFCFCLFVPSIVTWCLTNVRVLGGEVVVQVWREATGGRPRHHRKAADDQPILVVVEHVEAVALVLLREDGGENYRHPRRHCRKTCAWKKGRFFCQHMMALSPELVIVIQQKIPKTWKPWNLKNEP